MGSTHHKEPYGYYVNNIYCGWDEELGRFLKFENENEYLDYIFSSKESGGNENETV